MIKLICYILFKLLLNHPDLLLIVIHQNKFSKLILKLQPWYNYEYWRQNEPFHYVLSKIYGTYFSCRLVLQINLHLLFPTPKKYLNHVQLFLTSIKSYWFFKKQALPLLKKLCLEQVNHLLYNPVKRFPILYRQDLLKVI